MSVTRAGILLATLLGVATLSGCKDRPIECRATVTYEGQAAEGEYIGTIENAHCSKCFPLAHADACRQICKRRAKPGAAEGQSCESKCRKTGKESELFCGD